VIGDQFPSIASCLAPSQDRSQTVKEIVSILITEKDLLPSDSTPDDMVHCACMAIGDVLHICIFCFRSWFDWDSCLECQENHD
jgi:hypothetical protein